MSEERIPKRSEVPEQFKWALEDIYATDEKWAEDLQKLWRRDLKNMEELILS